MTMSASLRSVSRAAGGGWVFTGEKVLYELREVQVVGSGAGGLQTGHPSRIGAGAYIGRRIQRRAKYLSVRAGWLLVVDGYIVVAGQRRLITVNLQSILYCRMPRTKSPRQKRERKPLRPYWPRKSALALTRESNFLKQQSYHQKRLDQTKTEFQHPPAFGVKEQAQEEDQPDYTLQDFRKNREDVWKQAEVMTQLLNRNKISAANAFQVNVLGIEGVEAEHKSRREDIWKRWASILHAGYLVYGYKIDSFVNETYKFMGELSRRKGCEIQQVKLPTDTEVELINPIQYQSSVKMHLEMKPQALDVANLEQAFGTNPFFQKSKREFNECSLRSLLVNSLSIGSDISLSLYDKKSKPRPCRNPSKVKTESIDLIGEDKMPRIGLKDMIKTWTDDVNRMGRLFIGPGHTDKYQSEELNLDNIPHPVSEQTRTINPGHLQWSDTKSLRSEGDISYHNPSTWDKGLKVQTKEEQRVTIQNLNSIGRGNYTSNWLLKREEVSQGLKFDQRLRLKKNQVLKKVPEQPALPQTYYINADKYYLQGPPTRRLNFLKLHYKEDFAEARTLRRKFRKHYIDRDDSDASEQDPLPRHKPIRVIQQRVKKLKNIESAPLQQGQQVLVLEKCYGEYIRNEQMSVSKFFMTFLHMANQNDKYKIVSSDYAP